MIDDWHKWVRPTATTLVTNNDERSWMLSALAWRRKQPTCRLHVYLLLCSMLLECQVVVAISSHCYLTLLPSRWDRVQGAARRGQVLSNQTAAINRTAECLQPNENATLSLKSIKFWLSSSRYCSCRRRNCCCACACCCHCFCCCF